ncbi:hypothetical protein NM208_g4219 [Fusarium decemcellulare]|uniref:Uncharacterized protein n=1 Tax=Fusarium decemcellulare TaxID=57161 RepID=A0ACC1SLD8_9HYPO|nr:hypothetical protein NM208_g4219 [Fusarium decemcellulare]
MAVSLACGLIEEVAPLLDQQEGGLYAVIHQFYITFCLEMGCKRSDVIIPGGFNANLYVLADYCYFGSIIHLRTLAAALRSGLPVNKNGSFSAYDADLNFYDIKSGKKQYDQDAALLLDYLVELIIAIRDLPDYPVEDEFMRIVAEFDKTHHISLSLVFAVQIFLDIHHKLGDKARKCYNIMVDEVDEMRSGLESHVELHKNIKSWTWPAANDDALQALLRKTKLMGKDPVYARMKKMYRDLGEPVPAKQEANGILIYSPVLAGLYLFELRRDMHDMGIAVANAWASIVPVAHLYNALGQEGLLKGQWRDMEWMLKIVDNADLWVGGQRPDTPKDYFQKFSIQFGMSTASLVPNRRHKNTLKSRGGGRGISEGAPVSATMTKIQTSSEAKMNWTAELIDDLVARGLYEIEDAPDDGKFNILRTPAQEQRSRDRRRQQKVKARAAGVDKTTDSIVAENVVKTLFLALHSETCELTFPFLQMHRWCFEILQPVRVCCEPVLWAFYPAGLPDNWETRNEVVQRIFLTASGFDGGEQDMRLLNLAAEPFNALIGSKDGTRAIRMLHKIGKHVSFQDGSPFMTEKKWED